MWMGPLALTHAQDRHSVIVSTSRNSPTTVHVPTHIASRPTKCHAVRIKLTHLHAQDRHLLLILCVVISHSAYYFMRCHLSSQCSAATHPLLLRSLSVVALFCFSICGCCFVVALFCFPFLVEAPGQRAPVRYRTITFSLESHGHSVGRRYALGSPSLSG